MSFAPTTQAVRARGGHAGPSSEPHDSPSPSNSSSAAAAKCNGGGADGDDDYYTGTSGASTRGYRPDAQAAAVHRPSHSFDATVLEAGQTNDIHDPDDFDNEAATTYPPPQSKSSFSFPGLVRAYPAAKWTASLGTALQPVEWRIAGVITLIAAFFRFWRLDRPSSVVFDEVHFGNFAGKYIRRHFFMDVHPPLAKLLITLAAYMGGYNGKFDFSDIANEYVLGDAPGQPVPYVAMRRVAAIAGWLLVPVAFITLRAAGIRTGSAVVGACFVLLDNALATQSRYVLLDAPLVFFTATTVLSWVCFSKEDARYPFSRTWWAWLLATGLSLGLVLSVKWVGLFTVATIGIATLAKLWFRLADRRTTLWGLCRHFVARVMGLILIPLTVYATTFYIHLWILNESGDGDGFMSPQFQHALQGRELEDTFANVALGSAVTMRHINTRGGYLHSHPFNYETGSKQQQITLYPHSDDNNVWEIVAAPPPDSPPQVDDNGVPITLPQGSPRDAEKHWNSLEWLKNTAEVRIVHKPSDKRLHSHNLRPPITEADYQNEVSAYGSPGFTGDGNDNWIVEIDQIDSPRGTAREQVVALRTVFRLRHYNSGCYLFSHNQNLPEWGFGQQEVTCNQWPTRPNTLFYIESNTHPLLVNDTKAEKVNYPIPSFWSKFIELQKVMWRTNAGLTARHVYDSRPHQWPLLRRGINYWSKQHRQVYFIGNPLIWFLAVIAIGLYLVVRVLLLLRAKRGYKELHNTTVAHYDGLMAFLVLGYALHYVPFFAMQRQLFLHHYLPALYFAILAASVLLDAVTARFKPRTRIQTTIVLVLAALFVFSRLSPLISAGRWTEQQCMAARLRNTWDFDCINFPTNANEYNHWPGVVHTAEDTQDRHMPPLPTLPLVPKVPSGTASNNFGAPQPGNHAFEQPAHKAQDSANPVPQQAQNSAPPAPPAEEHFKEETGSSLKGTDSAASPEDPLDNPTSSTSSSTSLSSSVADGPNAQGLDAKQIQKMVLGGTNAPGLKASGASDVVGTGTTALAA